MTPRPAAATALLLLASCAHQPRAEPEAAKPALVVNVASAGEAKAADSPQGSVAEPADEAEPSAEEQRDAEHERIAKALADLDLDDSQVLGTLGGDPNDVVGVLSAGGTSSGGGFGGLGLRGTGRGGGGTGQGIGIGTIGPGGGTGSGSGRLGRSAAGAGGVKPSAPAVTGSLHKDIIRRVIRQNLTQIRYCYERELVRDPKLEGKVVVRFVIALDGSVKAASIAESLHPTVDACVKRSFMRMKFPKPDKGIVTVSYPLKFSIADSASTTSKPGPKKAPPPPAGSKK